MNKLSKQVLIDIDYIKSELTLIQKKSRSRIVVYSCVTNNYDNQISVNNFSSKFDPTTSNFMFHISHESCSSMLF